VSWRLSGVSTGTRPSNWSHAIAGVGRRTTAAFCTCSTSCSGVFLFFTILGGPVLDRDSGLVLGGLACIFLLVEEGVQRGMSPGLLALTMIIPLSSALSNTFYKWKLPHVPAAPFYVLWSLLVPAQPGLPGWTIMDRYVRAFVLPPFISSLFIGRR
jgi:hypothetical protein